MCEAVSIVWPQARKDGCATKQFKCASHSPWASYVDPCVGVTEHRACKLGEGGGCPPYRRLVESIGGHVWGCERVVEQIDGGVAMGNR